MPPLDAELLLKKIRSDFLVEQVEIGSSSELLLSGLLDSLAVVNLVAWIEDTIGQVIDPGEIVVENFESVESITAFINQRV